MFHRCDVVVAVVGEHLLARGDWEQGGPGGPTLVFAVATSHTFRCPAFIRRRTMSVTQAPLSRRPVGGHPGPAPAEPGAQHFPQAVLVGPAEAPPVPREERLYEDGVVDVTRSRGVCAGGGGSPARGIHHLAAEELHGVG